MSISLTPQLEALIHQKVESGQYGDANEVIREALETLEARDQFNRTKAAIASGIAQIERGEGIPWTEDSMDELIRAADEAERLGLPISDDVLP